MLTDPETREQTLERLLRAIVDPAVDSFDSELQEAQELLGLVKPPPKNPPRGPRKKHFGPRKKHFRKGRPKAKPL